METDGGGEQEKTAAREFISSLANQFGDPEQMLAFVHACDRVQAMLADCLFKEHRFYCIQKSLYVRGVPSDKESQMKIEVAWNEYRQASKEFLLAKGTLKDIIAQLDMAAEDSVQRNRL